MTLHSQLAATQKTQATVRSSTPRGGSYISLPADREIPVRAGGHYVSLPGALPGNANKAQGTYVTLHSAPAGETEISYTRVG
ncbi:hypothetical protein ACFVYC_00955 [Pseudarthrobacter sp. NPDC058329]|uniref:hypothetical protein n=1 Tax=Pseudarthrobacter sp. NPDC058329 TaxID=3346448 RepID=UPI0036DF2150